MLGVVSLLAHFRVPGLFEDLPKTPSLADRMFFFWFILVKEEFSFS